MTPSGWLHGRRRDGINATANLRAARDQLTALRTDYAQALEEFRWPDVGASFNWAHDWFDTWARDNDRPGLVVVEDDGSRAEYSFADLVRRSDQVAGLLADAGLGKGDSVIVMLGNQVELWESMLAIVKLGAVVMPTTTAVGPNGARRPDQPGQRPGRHLDGRRRRQARLRGGRLREGRHR